MGTWGPAIFSNDTSADVRDDFRNYVAEGLSSKEAASLMLSEWADSIEDEDERCNFWLGLAATQWKTGRLLDHVREQALAIINSDEDLQKWAESSPYDRRARAKYLKKLREQLLSPQPPAKKLQRRKKSTTDFEEGDVAVYKYGNTIGVRFCVLRIWSDKGGTYSNICLLGIDDGTPFNKKKITLAETLLPHFTMLDHEPSDKVRLLRKKVQLPEMNKETFGAWHRMEIHGYASTWNHFPKALDNILPKLGWL